MDAVNDIIEKVCAHMKKILDAGVWGSEKAQNSTFSKNANFPKNRKISTLHNKINLFFAWMLSMT